MVVLACNGVLAIFPSETFAAGTKPPLRIVAYGDSLVAGYMLPPEQAFPAQLQTALVAKGYDATVVNAGVSGDTTAAGLERFDWAMSERADAVILELGANDALRGLDPAVTRANLDMLITRLKATGAIVLLAGMRAPANWGEDYKTKFDAIFPELAAKHGVALYPFFLDGVALEKRLTMSDGIHPNGEGIGEIVKRILPAVETLLAGLPAGSANPSN